MTTDNPTPEYRRYFSALAFAALAFLALDALWLWTMASRLYRPEIGHVMREDFDAWAAAAFYVIYLCGMVGFVVMPAASVRGAAVRGALFGLVAYATYDLTNQATIRNWSWTVTLADLCWGMFATACAAAVAFYAASRRKR